MGICPLCRTKIDYLRAVFSIREEWVYDEDGVQDCLTDSTRDSFVPDHYLCPECFEEIASSEHGALEILRTSELEDKVERAARE